MIRRLHTIEERFQTDTVFRTCVQMLEGIIERLEMTPSEIRECAMYACMRIEMRKPISFRISREDAEAFCRQFPPRIERSGRDDT